jgi:YD repeat-containing protein
VKFETFKEKSSSLFKLGEREDIYGYPKDGDSPAISTTKTVLLTSKSAKGNETPTDKVYYTYYPEGLVKESYQIIKTLSSYTATNVSKSNFVLGTPSFYLWGYEKTKPIAKLDNFSSEQITPTIQGLIDAVVTASNNDFVDNANEGALRTALQNLRAAIPNAMMTSYTYDPLIGVTSITDPRGQTVYYDYDGFGRLITVKDSDGNLVSTNTYHYKNQQ